VLKCVHRTNGQTFAAKFVQCAAREDRRNVEREVDIMNTLKSTRLLHLYDAFDNGRGEFCLITEYVGGGELFDRVIEDEFVLTERACSCFCRQILEGVAYMHNHQIIHLDLKPENILCLTRKGNRVKIIDFGLARRFEPQRKLQVLFGTPEFVAPEVVNFEPIGYPTDMWAVGVITYVLLSGLSPFMGDTDLETMANVTIAEYDYEDEAFDSISEEAKDFIDRLLIKDKDRRSTAEQCLRHPWLANGMAKEQPPSPEKERKNSLAAAKHNLSSQREQWAGEQSGGAPHEFCFDRPSRTISMAPAGSPSPSTELPPELPSPTSPSTHLLTVPSSPPTGQRLATSSSMDSVRSTASAVITLDQIRRKAEEIVERKNSCNSFCSINRPLEIEAEGRSTTEDDVSSIARREDLAGDESDDEGCEDVGTPKCQSPSPPQQMVGTFTSGPNTPKVNSSVGEAPSPPPVNMGEANSRRYSTSALAATQCSVDQPLWQAAERTLTPLWELATNHSSSLASSSNVSKSNSELSIRACLAGCFL